MTTTQWRLLSNKPHVLYTSWCQTARSVYIWMSNRTFFIHLDVKSHVLYTSGCWTARFPYIWMSNRTFCILLDVKPHVFFICWCQIARTHAVWHPDVYKTCGLTSRCIQNVRFNIQMYRKRAVWHPDVYRACTFLIIVFWSNRKCAARFFDHLDVKPHVFCTSGC